MAQSPESVQRTVHAYAWRLAGDSYAVIATRLGISPSRVRAIIQAYEYTLDHLEYLPRHPAKWPRRRPRVYRWHCVRQAMGV